MSLTWIMQMKHYRTALKNLGSYINELNVSPSPEELIELDFQVHPSNLGTVCNSKLFNHDVNLCS